MKQVKLIAPNGNAILAPETDVEYLLSQGFTHEQTVVQVEEFAVDEDEE